MRILIFGGNGTVGKPLVGFLANNHYIYAPSKENFDLLYRDPDSKIDCGDIYHDKYDLVIHLGAVKTNISLNNTNPVDIYTETVKMGMSVFEIARHGKIPRIVQCVCSCSYADCGDSYLWESNFDNGRPHHSILPHAHAKRQLYYLAKFYKQQYGIETITICFNNVYGGFPNNISLEEKQSLKVLDSLFIKILSAKIDGRKEVEIWGTGKPRREFIYYRDAARAIERIVNSTSLGIDLLNIGSQKDYSISYLARLLKKKIGYTGKLVFNKDKPDGQMRKLLNSSHFRRDFTKFQFTSLDDGISEMIEDYT